MDVNKQGLTTAEPWEFAPLHITRFDPSKGVSRGYLAGVYVATETRRPRNRYWYVRVPISCLRRALTPQISLSGDRRV